MQCSYKHPLYNVWNGMLQRCYNPSEKTSPGMEVKVSGCATVGGNPSKPLCKIWGIDQKGTHLTG